MIISIKPAWDVDDLADYLDRRKRFARKCRRELKRTAHHEAGHAVCQIARKIPLDWVGIQPLPPGRDYLTGTEDEFTMGICWGRPRSYGQVQDRWGDLLVSCLAGPVAEMRFIGSSRLTLTSSDREQANLYLGASRLDERSTFRDYHDLARLFVDRHWRAIEAVAAALVEHRYLEARDVRRIVRAAE